MLHVLRLWLHKTSLHCSDLCTLGRLIGNKILNQSFFFQNTKHKSPSLFIKWTPKMTFLWEPYSRVGNLNVLPTLFNFWKHRVGTSWMFVSILSPYLALFYFIIFEDSEIFFLLLRLFLLLYFIYLEWMPIRRVLGFLDLPFLILNFFYTISHILVLLWCSLEKFCSSDSQLTHFLLRSLLSAIKI